MDTATDDNLGLDQWSTGPTELILRIDGPWVVGSLASYIWNFASDSVNFTTMQPFLNYNFPEFYLTSSLILTSDWSRDGETWTIPLGGRIGKIMRW